MKVGLFPMVTNPFATGDYLEALARGAEERGFHSLWAPEHVVLFDEYRSRYPYAADGRIPAGGETGIFEPFLVLTHFAAVTRRIRVGTGICLVPQRNPVYTAKQVATLDFVSGGRFDFGVGVGWLREEFEAVGVPFERRGARCREYLAVMRTLWCDPVSSFEGEFYRLPPCRHYPKPVQQPHPPIHFGGESKAALERVADLGQGWYTFNRSPEELAAALPELDRLLAERGRSRSEVMITVCPYMRPLEEDAMERYREAGADQVILVMVAPDLASLEKNLDQLAETHVARAARL